MAAKDNMETSEKCVIELECTKDSQPFETRTVTILSGGEKLVGRYHKKKHNAKQEETNLLFDTRMLSHSHATLFFEDGKLYLKDLCSSNGTYLNGEYIGPERGDMNEPKGRVLKTGDILRFGKLRAIAKQSDEVKPIEAKLTIKYAPSSEELNETMVCLSNYTPYEGRELDQTMAMEQQPKKKPILANKEIKRTAEIKSTNITERGTETESVKFDTMSTQVLPDELEKPIDCDNCKAVSGEFYKYRKRALVTIAFCLLIIVFYQQYLNF